jgi:benzaldehyde dehydrogenase (NAD)
MRNERSVTVAHDLMDPAIWGGRMYANGWRESVNGALDVTDKSTGQVLGTIASASPAEMHKACEVAQMASWQWASKPAEQRAAIMRHAADLLDRYKEEVSYWIVRESGSTRMKADGEIQGSREILYHSAKLALRPGTCVLKNDSGMLSFIERIPLGVVGVISPFNYPLALAIRAVAPALAMGNAVIVKPDIETAVSGGVVIARLFEEAGLPGGILQVLPGDSDVGTALVEDTNVSMVSFTGSSAPGRKIGAAAGATLKRVSLELGGKNPFIVLPDADVELAAHAGMFGSFFHQGQICMAVGLHLVHESLIDRYSARVAEFAKAIKVGDPYLEAVGLGPISKKQRDKVHAIVEDAVRSGAKLVEGGRFDDLFYRPTVLKNVPTNSRAFKEEIFGPVAVIVAFKDENEAIQVANGTGYGLAASVFGEAEHAMQVGKQIETGMLHINDTTLLNDREAPFGGLKASGNGSRMEGDADLHEFTTWRWTTETRQSIPYEIPAT